MFTLCCSGGARGPIPAPAEVKEEGDEEMACAGRETLTTASLSEGKLSMEVDQIQVLAEVKVLSNRPAAIAKSVDNLMHRKS